MIFKKNRPVEKSKLERLQDRYEPSAYAARYTITWIDYISKVVGLGLKIGAGVLLITNWGTLGELLLKLT